jgi:hypothetical protein
VGNSGTPAQNKQQTPSKGYSIVRVNQVSADATPDGAEIVLGIFYISTIPATILFDSSATHSFMSARYANTNEIPLKNYGKRILGYHYNTRGKQYRSDPWYVMVKKGKDHYTMW